MDHASLWERKIWLLTTSQQDYCNSLLMGLPSVIVGKFQVNINSKARQHCFYISYTSCLLATELYTVCPCSLRSSSANQSQVPPSFRLAISAERGQFTELATIWHFTRYRMLLLLNWPWRLIWCLPANFIGCYMLCILLFYLIVFSLYYAFLWFLTLRTVPWTAR